MTNEDSANNSSGDDLLLSSLVLFACSAKLWLLLTLNHNARNDNARRRRRNDDRHRQQQQQQQQQQQNSLQPSSSREWIAPSSSSFSSKTSSLLSSSLRRSQRISDAQPWPIIRSGASDRKKKRLEAEAVEAEEEMEASHDATTTATTTAAAAAATTTESALESSFAAAMKSPPKSPPRKRKMSEDARMLLMDRVSLSDMVLTRETSLDFHPKNSNWSHFENYATSSSSNSSVSPPKKPVIVKEISEGKELDEETEEEEDFLWSDPPMKFLRSWIGQAKPHGQNDKNDENNNETNDAAMNATSLYTNNSLLRRSYCRKASSATILHSNSECLPSKLILVRHGQSEGNIDELLYATKPDNAMGLTELGWEMARMAGKALKAQLPPGETVHFVVSPYARTVETFHGIAAAWADPEEFRDVPDRSRRLKLWYTKLMEMGLTWHEDPRIREQDFGNYQDPHVIKKAKAERHKFGSFYYRFPHGESASDVFDRVSTFLDSLWRSFESGRAQNYVLVAHGISIRVFLARYFRYSIDQFHMLANPKNCEMVMLAHDGLGRLKLDGRCELELNEVDVDSSSTKDVKGRERGDDTITSHDDDGKFADVVDEKKDGVQTKPSSLPTTNTTTKVTGFKKHLRLRTLPPQYVRPRTVRMCYGDTC